MLSNNLYKLKSGKKYSESQSKVKKRNIWETPLTYKRDIQIPSRQYSKNTIDFQICYIFFEYIFEYSPFENYNKQTENVDKMTKETS